MTGSIPKNPSAAKPPTTRASSRATSEPETLSEQFAALERSAKHSVKDGEPSDRPSKRLPVKGDNTLAYMQDVKQTCEDSLQDVINLVTSIRTSIEDLRNTQDSFRLQLLELSKDVDTLRESSPAHIEANNLAHLTDQVRSLRTDVNTLLERDSEPRTSVLGQFDNRLERVNNRLTHIEDSDAIVDSRISALETNIAEVFSRLSQVEPSRPKVDTEGHNGRDTHHDNNSREPHYRSRQKKSKRHTRRDPYLTKSSDSDISCSSSSLESDSDSDSEPETSRHRDERGGIFGRKKGRKHPGLRELNPTNRDYKRLLSYRYYRLKRSSSRRTGRETSKVKDQVSRMNVSLRDLTFDGVDGILVLEFLARFVAEADILEMSEAQAFLALPYFLRGFAAEQFRSTIGASRRDGGVVCWPEAVQYLLRSYATNEAIQDALRALKNVQQTAGETELDYSNRLNRAERRCGNPHRLRDRVTDFISGLDPAVKPLVYRFREENPRSTFLDIVAKARAEGEARRATISSQRRASVTLRQETQNPHGNRGTRHTGKASVHLVEQSEPSPHSSVELRQPSTSAPADDNIHYLTDNGVSIDTYRLPSTRDTDTPTAQSLLEIESRAPRTVPNASIPYSQYDGETRRGRPGWVDTRQLSKHPSASQDYRQARFPPGLICHTCYRRGHIAPDCILPVRELESIVSNYDKLTEDEKLRVPATSYWRARALSGRGEEPPSDIRPVHGTGHTPRPLSPRPILRRPQTPHAPSRSDYVDKLTPTPGQGN